MAKQYTVTISSGTATGPYNIYYDSVDPLNIATVVSTSLPATGITYSDLTSFNGVLVEIPDEANKIVLYNTDPFCLVGYDIPLPTPTPTPTATPTPTPSPTPTPTPNCEFGVDAYAIMPTPTPTPTPTPSPTPTPTPTPNCEFGIDIDVNYPPTDISLSNNTINENNATGTTIGELSVTTLDSSDTHTYSIISGATNF